MSVLLTLAEAAEELRLSARTVRRLVNRGEIPAITLTGTPKGDRIDRGDLLAFIEKSRRLRVVECPSENVVQFGKFPSRSADRELENRLAVVRRKRTPTS